MTRSGVPLFCLALLAGCQTMSTPPDLGEVEAVERARFQTFTRADTAAMEKGLGDDLLYCHSSGKCQTKKELIAAFASKDLVYRKLDLISSKARAIGGAVLINGKVEIGAEQSGQPVTFQAVYSDVYVKRDGRWQLVSWQSTRSP
ncbi:MAG: nuclear transport factor 2 family protein [Gammaproteobacteria bacterium]